MAGSKAAVGRRESNGAAECSGGKIVAIEMPAQVTNVDKALELLGGVRAITQTLSSSGASTSHGQSSEKKLTLRFDPSDRAFRPLEATRWTPKNPLFKVFKVVPDGEGKEWAEELGQVKEAHRFASLADFYHPCGDANVEDVESVNEGLNVILEEKSPEDGKDGVNIIPPFFSKMVEPVDLMKSALAVSRKDAKKKKQGPEIFKNKKKNMSSAKIKRAVNALLKTTTATRRPPPTTATTTKNSICKASNATEPPPPDSIVRQAEADLEQNRAKPAADDKAIEPSSSKP
jgi:hypothetical protein